VARRSAVAASNRDLASLVCPEKDRRRTAASSVAAHRENREEVASMMEQELPHVHLPRRLKSDPASEA